MKVAFCTLGCKVNFYETEKMMAKFSQHGFEVVEAREDADIYVINTCTVTNMADRKSRQMIHRGKKKNPNCLVVAVGCYAQSDGEQLRKDPEIDLVLDNQLKENIVSYVEEALGISSVKEEKNEGDSYDFLHERTRAFIKIQNGCNQFCTYCIIPFVRGKLTSRLVQEVVEEVKQLASQGFKEFVLTGIHLSSYGVDWTECKNFVSLEGKYLLELLNELAQIDGVHRLRLGSLEPRIITKSFLEGLAENKKICPHFHLSLQSGCDATLKRMNRHYSAKEYEEKCNLLRSYFKNPAITTDVIVGFPGETEDEFMQTFEYLSKIKLAEMHIFKYSKRDGTKAAVMPDQVPEQEKTRRSGILLALDEKLRAEYNSQVVGTDEEVLFEEMISLDEENYLVGHTTRYVKVAVPAEKAKELGLKENEIDTVRVEKVL